MIQINRLTKTFADVKAVNDLTLTIYPGVNGLVGENGAGKSTLLRLLSDVYQTEQGEIIIDDKPHDCVENKRKMFFLCDNPVTGASANIKGTFELYSSLFDLDKERFDGIIKELRLPEKRRVATFSKGMRRQLFLAIALSFKGEYVLLDEAFDGLDPLVLDTIRQEIIKDADQKTYIVSSHNISSLERLCDNFILLSKGRCKKTGNIGDLGTNFAKYQLFIKDEIKAKDIEALGYKILSFKKVGSIYNIVFYNEIDDKNIKEKYDVLLLERIPIDPDEIIALEMLNARKEVNNHDAISLVKH